MNNTLIHAIPDWDIQQVFLVWNEISMERRRLMYLPELIKAIPETIKVTIIVKDEITARDVVPFCRDNRSVDVIQLPTIMDIWIRDWAPFPVTDVNGRKSLVKAV